MGPILELVIDSVSAAGFRVRIGFLLQGDVVIEPSRFEPAWGARSADTVRFGLRLRGQQEDMGQFQGVLARDTIRLARFRWAGEDQTARGLEWYLVRQR